MFDLEGYLIINHRQLNPGIVLHYKHEVEN